MNPDLDPGLASTILSQTGASEIASVSTIQDLWSGYGKILRIHLIGGARKSLVAKLIRPPNQNDHPRGWNSDFAHQRKVKSYEVETEWYRHWAHRCHGNCRIPEFLGYFSLEHCDLLLLEDLDDAGFPKRRSQLSRSEIAPCLEWLARFHACFLSSVPEGLWKTGTYWHLETRPDEWRAIKESSLKQSAAAIDQQLSRARFLTLVHGDAKLANFCFSPNGDQVAMVDFQYVGGGCGMKDVAYFLGSCLAEEECEKWESALLEIYFDEFQKSVREHHPKIDPEEIVREWTSLFPVAWTDFHRFLMGWCPDHWKVNRYSLRLAKQVTDRLLPAP